MAFTTIRLVRQQPSGRRTDCNSFSDSDYHHGLAVLVAVWMYLSLWQKQSQTANKSWGEVPPDHLQQTGNVLCPHPAVP